MSGSWARILGPGNLRLDSWCSLGSWQDGGLKTDFLQSSPGWKHEDSSDQNGSSYMVFL